MRAHLTKDSAWADCDCAGGCLLPHVDDMAAAEVARLPASFLDSILETFDPPTRTWTNGTREWRNEQEHLHRGYGLPALIHADGARLWYRDGYLHRDNGLPAAVQVPEHCVYRTAVNLQGGYHVEVIKGQREWWVEGELHRHGGPAVIHHDDGGEEWWVNGYRHRADGLPAVTKANGEQEYWNRGWRTSINSAGDLTMYRSRRGITPGLPALDPIAGAR